jgi:hypothetical protein
MHLSENVVVICSHSVRVPRLYWHYWTTVCSACIMYTTPVSSLGLYGYLRYSHDRIIVTKSGPDDSIHIPKHIVLYTATPTAANSVALTGI